MLILSFDNYLSGSHELRQQQMELAGLSSLKYADATSQGFNRISNAKYANNRPIVRNFKELSQQAHTVAAGMSIAIIIERYIRK